MNNAHSDFKGVFLWENESKRCNNIYICINILFECHLLLNIYFLLDSLTIRYFFVSFLFVCFLLSMINYTGCTTAQCQKLQVTKLDIMRHKGEVEMFATRYCVFVLHFTVLYCTSLY